MTADRQTFYDRMAAARGDWDEWTNTYETARRLDVIFGRLLADSDLSGRPLLDAGCGGGHFSAAARRRGARVTSLDVGVHLLAQVARRCESRGIVGSVLDLPFADGSFDVVLSTEVVEHTTDPVRGLREIVRVVRPGGRVVITTPGRLWQPVVRAASALRLRPYQGYENFVWPAAARRTLEEASLVVDSFFGFNLLPLFRPAFGRLHALMDRAGRAVPSLYVNFAIAGTKGS